MVLAMVMPLVLFGALLGLGRYEEAMLRRKDAGLPPQPRKGAAETSVGHGDAIVVHKRIPLKRCPTIRATHLASDQPGLRTSIRTRCEWPNRSSVSVRIVPQAADVARRVSGVASVATRVTSEISTQYAATSQGCPSLTATSQVAMNGASPPAMTAEN
jgi:hypothetical protein